MARTLERYLTPQVGRDLARKMVWLAGPRQVGKTTLARSLPGGREGYLSWDVASDRARLLRRELPPAKLWVLDEVHKYRSWRNYLKGLWDGRRPGQRLLVTGSARLELYGRGGDSGPLPSCGSTPLGGGAGLTAAAMTVFRRAPGPFLGGSRPSASWSREYRSRLITGRVTSLERVVDLGNLELLAMRLPELVGSPLSLNALREDLQVSHKTVATWVRIFERLHAIFRLPPFGAPSIRAVKKEQKHYQMDWSLVPGDPARFENLAACHLLKWVHYEQDVKGRDLELRYFRDTDGREVDLVVTERARPILLVECKWGDAPLDRSLRYLKSRFPPADAWQISATGRKDFVTPEGIRVAPAVAFLRTLV